MESEFIVIDGSEHLEEAAFLGWHEQSIYPYTNKIEIYFRCKVIYVTKEQRIISKIKQSFFV